MSAWRDLISRISRPCSVLIVEDQPLIAQDLAALVQEAGATVVGIAADSVDALLLAAEHRPDVALIDIDMNAGGDVLRLAREIREMTDASIVFCGSDDLTTQARLLVFGRVQLLPKPVDFESLSRAMLRVCQA
jgi:DNA-binding NarL/FixJ family response regulator